MPMKERRRGISTIVGCGKRDLISVLPDEIIYDIFARLRSQKQTAQAAVLSRRWADLWRSYPILEIYLRDGALDWVEDRSMRHKAAVLEKFSRQSYIQVVRIAVTIVPIAYKDVYFAFVNGVLDLAAKKSASEIDFDFGTPCHIPASLLLSSLCRLRVLKLRKCCILGNISGGYDNPFASFGSSLKVLCLYGVTFSDVGVLNSMIEAASLLENLSLAFVLRLERLEVTNHTKLKTLEVERCNYITDINIIGAHSLEILRLEYYNAEETDLHVSLTPNVKVLHLRDVLLLTDDKLNKLISEFPSLETLVLDKLYLPPIMIKIDSSRLTKFVYHPYADCFPTILFKANGCKETSLSLSFSFNNGFHELKQFLVKLCQFRLTLHFTDPVSRDRNHRRRKLAIFKLQKEREKGTPLNETTWNLPTKMQIPWDQITDEQPIPTIECVTFSASYVCEKDNFMDILFWVCHPKSLCALKGKDNSHNYLSSLEYMCYQFMERGSSNHCTLPSCQCWRHQLKDVKIVSTREKDKPVNISSVMISSLVKQEQEQIWFILAWN